MKIQFPLKIELESVNCIHILVAVEHFTRWQEAWALPNIEAGILARTLVDELICRHGAPEMIPTDRGTNFTSKLMALTCSKKKLSDVLFKITDLKRRRMGNHSHKQNEEVQSTVLVERMNGIERA